MTVRILHGDALEQLRTLADESVQCVVTSPPYFGLRDYGTAEWDGATDDCDHVERTAADVSTSNGLGRIAGYRDSLPADNAAFKSQARQFRDECGKCGAIRIDRQIGLESTPAEYIAKMVTVFREVRRVLRKDGVCWLNIGDSYAGSGRGGGSEDSKQRTNTGSLITPRGSRLPAGMHESARLDGSIGRAWVAPAPGFKQKDLMGMPWRLAFALQADGWYLRQDIIWSKPNPMPESVTDRCTKAHEYVFLLSKSATYFYDSAAISEPAIKAGLELDYTGGQKNNTGDVERLQRTLPNGRVIVVPDRRNKRSVWTITTEPYPEAHFATFPTELPRICILAGSKIGDTILDPFAGSGTTLQVALELSRAAIGIELNAEYVALANRRLNGTTLGLPLEIAA